MDHNATARRLIISSRVLARDADRLVFSAPVRYVYDPLIYARVPYEMYLARFGAGKKRVVFLGMNPGPWGMAQTGVPFGEVAAVKTWLGISGSVKSPVRFPSACARHGLLLRAQRGERCASLGSAS